MLYLRHDLVMKIIMMVITMMTSMTRTPLMTTGVGECLASCDVFSRLSLSMVAHTI